MIYMAACGSVPCAIPHSARNVLKTDDETLFEYYDGMTFTEDDFFCNLEKEG